MARENHKITGNIFSKGIGFKHEGKRIFKNAYSKIDVENINNLYFPHVVAKNPDSSVYEIYDINNDIVIKSDNPNLNLQIYSYDNGGGEAPGPLAYDMQSFMLKRNNEVFLVAGSRVYSAPKDFKRIEWIKEADGRGRNEIFVAIDKNNYCKFISNGHDFPEVIPINLSIIKEYGEKVNPYFYAIASGQISHKDRYNSGTIEIDDLKKSVKSYFDDKIENEKSSMEKINLIKERSNCLKLIVKNFKKQAQLCSSRIDGYKVENKKLKDKIKKYKEVEKETEKSLHREILDLELQISENKTSFKFDEGIIKISDKLTNLYLKRNSNDIKIDDEVTEKKQSKNQKTEDKVTRLNKSNTR